MDGPGGVKRTQVGTVGNETTVAKRIRATIPRAVWQNVTVEFIFATGNVKKAREVAEYFARHDDLREWVFIVHKDLNLDEYRCDDSTGTRQKCRLALQLLQLQASDRRRVVIVDDTVLRFDSIHGLPGPYVEHILEKVGATGLVKLGEGKGAQAICHYALAAANDNLGEWSVTVTGTVHGHVAEVPRGAQDYGWDTVFVPLDPKFNPGRQTYAEMSFKDYNATSHRTQALAKLADQLVNNHKKLACYARNWCLCDLQG